MSKKYIADKFEINGGTSSEFLLADGTTTTAPGGAVDSVNSQTGVVSLGLLELDDVGVDGTIGQVLTTNGGGAFSFTTVSGGGGGGGTVGSVNGQIGTVVLDTDDINEGTTNLYYTEAKVTANTSVTTNTSKVGITPTQASDITTNNSKTGITSTQASSITNNNNKISYTDASAVALNTSKVGVTPTQTSDITTNNAKVGYTEALVSANTNVSANTAKTGITTQQTNDITTNNAKVGITTTQANDILANNSKVGITPTQASDITTNNSKVGITPTQASNIVTNNSKVGITPTQASDIVTNNAKIGITPTQASDIVANNSKVSYTDSSIVSSHIGDITTNPHQVTKTNVGLANVPNIDCTDASNISTGTLPSSVIPPIALATVQVAASQVAMLALTTEEGDVVVRTDEDKTYMNNGGTAGTMADFTELQTPTDTVLSVNSQTGTVVLTTTNINEGTNLYYTEAKVTANTSVVANTAKVGITAQQSSDITTNNAKTGITTQQSNDITTNNSKISFDSASSSKLTGISAGAEVNAVDSVNGTTGAVSLGLLELDDVSTDGTSGQVLTTDGSGAFSFSTVSSSGVSKIVAGTNVTISPTGGTGDVTINSSTTQVNTSLESSESARNIIIGTSAIPPAISGVFENTIYFQREA
jgi:hypothetical protein